MSPLFVKLGLALGGGFFLLITLLAAAVSATVSALFGGHASPSALALADIPGDYLSLYQRAAQVCPGLDWSVLAGIGKVESDHSRLDAPGVDDGENFAGAAGPMQFLAPTFNSVVTRHPIPPGGSTPPSRYNPHDAIHAAAYYLCDSGARDGRDLYGAIFTYNHADWYVRKVLHQAELYRAAATTPAAGGWTVPVQGRCTSPFGPRDGGFHRGQDIAAPIGTPITAAADGTVLDAGPASGYGLWVRIQHAGGVVTVYGHNHRNLVRRGDHVRSGQPIAEVGNRGQSTGPHLHFQIEVGGAATDPNRFYADRTGRPLCP